MDAYKHFLTFFHCVMAAVVTSLGIWWASRMSETHLIGARVLALGAIMLPVLIATRVSWRAGFEAGRRQGADFTQAERMNRGEEL